MWLFARPVFQAHGEVDGAHLVNNTLPTPAGCVPLPRRPPHARLLDSYESAPPSPSIAPASPDWTIQTAWSLPRNIALFL